MPGFDGRFHALMTEPLVPWTRLMLLGLVIPLALSFTQPLWNIHLVAPQFSQSLDLDIYAHTIEGDIGEINTLNFSIGMARIDPRAFSELDWLPFVMGALILITLRVTAVGNVRSLIDLAVLLFYFSAFSLSRFHYMLYRFGHNLDPYATVEVEPFTPAILGTQQIADITASSYPQSGTWLIGVFSLGVVFLAVWHVFRGLRMPTAGALGRGG
jgi:hypothetical protein